MSAIRYSSIGSSDWIDAGIISPVSISEAMHLPTSSTPHIESFSVRAVISLCKVDGLAGILVIWFTVEVSFKFLADVVLALHVRAHGPGRRLGLLRRPVVVLPFEDRDDAFGWQGKSRSARQPRSFYPRQNRLRPTRSMASRTTGKPCSSIRSSSDRRRLAVIAFGTEKNLQGKKGCHQRH